MTKLLVALIALAAPLAGCATRTTDPREPGTTSPVLRIDGESIALGDAANAPVSLPTYVAAIQQRLSTGQDEAAGELVRLYPDLAERAVLSPNAHPPTQRVIAAWLDGLAAPAPGGWSAFIADRAENPNRYTAWAQDRANAWSALRRGAFDEVADQAIRLPTDSPTPWPALDATLLRATATLAAGRPADAAVRFEQAARLAAAWDHRVAARSHLFASLSHQLAGDPEAASRQRDAAALAVALHDIRDPMTLRLLLKTQPTPGPTPSALAAANPLTARQIRARLARVELERGAPQAALLAWRAAETEPGTQPTRDRLRLGQAEALIALGQNEPAIAMLIGLARTEVRPEALVMLGLVHMHRGQAEVGLAMLSEAVGGTTPETHPHVHADSGLALLSTGQTEAGTALVRQARAVYQARQDRPALRRLLTNELRYAQAVNDPERKQELRRALLEVN